MSPIPLNTFLCNEHKHFGLGPIGTSSLMRRCRLRLRWTAGRSSIARLSSRSSTTCRDGRWKWQGRRGIRTVCLQLAIQVNGQLRGRVLGDVTQMHSLFHRRTKNTDVQHGRQRIQTPGTHWAETETLIGRALKWQLPCANIESSKRREDCRTYRTWTTPHSGQSQYVSVAQSRQQCRTLHWDWWNNSRETYLCNDRFGQR